MRKTGWTIPLSWSCLVWQRISLWMWYLGASQQPFSCVLGHFPVFWAIFRMVRPRVAEVAREHGWHPLKSLDSDENFGPEHTLSKTVFLGQEVHYYMVYIAYFTELILQICDYAQKRRIWRENCTWRKFSLPFLLQTKGCQVLPPCSLVL